LGLRGGARKNNKKRWAANHLYNVQRYNTEVQTARIRKEGRMSRRKERADEVELEDAFRGASLREGAGGVKKVRGGTLAAKIAARLERRTRVGSAAAKVQLGGGPVRWLEFGDARVESKEEARKKTVVVKKKKAVLKQKTVGQRGGIEKGGKRLTKLEKNTQRRRQKMKDRFEALGQDLEEVEAKMGRRF